MWLPLCRWRRLILLTLWEDTYLGRVTVKRVRDKVSIIIISEYKTMLAFSSSSKRLSGNILWPWYFLLAHAACFPAYYSFSNSAWPYFCISGSPPLVEGIPKIWHPQIMPSIEINNLAVSYFQKNDRQIYLSLNKDFWHFVTLNHMGFLIYVWGISYKLLDSLHHMLVIHNP
jgi:hypothetical protein